MKNGELYLVINMSNTSSISEKQNSDENIQLLRAQRHSYFCAKRFYNSRMALSIIWPIISVSLALFEIYNTNLVLIISSIILLLTFLMEFLEKKFIKTGATIQEQFDTNVFGMKWNYALVGSKVSDLKIISLAKKEKSELHELANWYTGVNTEDATIYTLKSQKMNIEWSIHQKSAFGWLLCIIAALIFSSLIAIAICQNLLMTEFFLLLLLPTMPLFIYLIKGTVDFKIQVRELKRISLFIYSLLEKEKVYNYQLRFIQDAIFVHGRLPNNIIPDYLYKILRSKLESQFKEINK